MKYLILTVTVFAFAGITSASVKEGFDAIKAVIPEEKIVAVVRGCSDDEQIQLLATYLRSEEFHEVFDMARSNENITNVHNYLVDEGVTFEWLDYLMNLWNISKPEPYLAKKQCGGWRGIWDELDGPTIFAEVIKTVQNEKANNPEFRTAWNLIRYLDETIRYSFRHMEIQRFEWRLRTFGVDTDLLKQGLNDLFGWTLQY